MNIERALELHCPQIKCGDVGVDGFELVVFVRY